MRLMTGNAYFTVEELADKLDTTYRSIYRYIDTFRELGFAVEKIHGNVYRIVKYPSVYKDLEKLVYFSDEEARVVCGLIEGLDSSHALKAALYKKLAAIYDITSINEFKGSKSNAACIQHRQVVLKNYASSHSGEIRDRLVEPFGFTNNHLDVWAYDVEKGDCRLFKIPRIEWVDVLSSGWTYEEKHHRKKIDDFRMSYDGEGTRVRLELSLRAKNLLVEEFPTAWSCIMEADGKWYYEGIVGPLEGVGRFCIGLAGDVKVLEGKELKEYISEFVNKNLL